jgi:hypothetical protein
MEFHLPFDPPFEFDATDDLEMFRIQPVAPPYPSLPIHLIDSLTFMDIFQQTPGLAKQIIIQAQDECFDYSMFLNMLEPCLWSFEIIVDLLRLGRLTKEQMQHFIARCIRPKDLVLARLTALFLTKLIAEGLIDKAEYRISIPPFCLEFSRVGECVALLRLFS